jgi:hypothetical protein
MSQKSVRFGRGASNAVFGAGSDARDAPPALSLSDHRTQFPTERSQVKAVDDASLRCGCIKLN